MLAMRTASSLASARPAFMLCMPAGAVRCAASPASHTRPRPNELASLRSKRTSIDQPMSPARLANQGARSASSPRVRASSRCGKKRSPSIVVSRPLKRSAALTSGAPISMLQRARPSGSGQSAFTESSRSTRRSSSLDGAAHSKIANTCEGPASSSGVPSARRTSERWPSAPITKPAWMACGSPSVHSVWATA